MCQTCGCDKEIPSEAVEEDVHYMCGECGKISFEEAVCHDRKMDKVCECGSGQFSKDCCEVEEK